jgi:hypothetical protein
MVVADVADDLEEVRLVLADPDGEQAPHLANNDCYETYTTTLQILRMTTCVILASR